MGECLLVKFMDLFNLNGKKIMLVGGSGGIGKSILDAYLSYNVKIVVVDIVDIDSEYLKNKKVKFIKANISKNDEIIDSFSKGLLFLESIDILVNCAGIQRRNLPENFDLNDWDDVLQINLTATFLFCKLAGSIMLKENKGKIINIASIMSFLGGTTIPAYAASKGGVAQLTKALSNDWAKKGICVNAIAPGYFETNLNSAIITDKLRYDYITSRIPAKRWGKPKDIIGLIIFLSSAASDYITGTVIPIDGGYLSW
jgi:2-deoxy-D-gluconate 3-dehydrogenase